MNNSILDDIRDLMKIHLLNEAKLLDVIATLSQEDREVINRDIIKIAIEVSIDHPNYRKGLQWAFPKMGIYIS